MRGRILLAHLLSLLAGGLFLLHLNQSQWFFGDEWEFLGGVRRTTPWYDQLLQPHNEHWSTAPYVVYRLLEAAFGIRSYWPYIGLAIVLHLVVVHLVWRVMLQARITPWVATVVVLPLIVLGAGSQNLLWAFQIGFLGSVAFGLGSMLLVNHDGAWRRRDWAGLALIMFALLWSGISVLLVAVCVLVVLLRRGIKPAAAFGIPPAVVYTVWAVAYPPPTNLAAPSVQAFANDLWPFVATGLSTATNAFVLDAPLLGSIGLVVLAVYLVRTAERATTEAAVAYACAVGALAQFVLSAYGRQKLGIAQSTETRYAYIAIILLAPALALALDRLLRGANPMFRAAFVIVLLMLTFTNAQLLRDAASDEAAREQPIRTAILAAAQIANDPTQVVNTDASPEPTYSPDLTVADLRRFGANDELPELRPTLEQLLSSAASIQTGLAETPEDPACAVKPTAPATLIPAGRDGAMVVLNGPPGIAVTFALRDPATGTQGTSRQIALTTAWSKLTVYRRGVDLSIVVPPNVHVCPVEG